MRKVPTVLVVDDDAFMRHVLVDAFSRAGFEVETFTSANDLLARADLSPPAVLLLDVQLPGMSGPELQLLLRERGVSIPVIFLTGSSDIPIAVAAMRNGAVDFIEKPFHHATLVDSVRRALALDDRTPSGASAPGYAIRVATLTPRERQVLDAMVTGKTSKQIARELGCSFRTIDTHRARVMAKMEAVSLAELVRRSVEAEQPTSTTARLA